MCTTPLISENFVFDLKVVPQGTLATLSTLTGGPGKGTLAGKTMAGGGAKVCLYLHFFAFIYIFLYEYTYT